MARILGIDVSNLQGAINWNTVALAPVGVAVIKVSEGTTYADPFAAANQAGARKQLMHVGGYHFARPSKNTGHEEATYFFDLVSNMGFFDFHVLDLEDTYVDSRADLKAYVVDFHDTWAALGGGPLTLYVGPYYADEHNVDNQDVSDLYALWLASWQLQAPVTIHGWPRYVGWQFTDAGVLPGLGAVDLSLWDPDFIELPF